MMNNTPVSKLDLNIYDFQLDNGLTVYVVPVKKRNNIYVTFTTKYGSRVNEFIPLGKKEMKKVPLGVAHFLEHKMFEQKNGIDPFDFFSERGASANANTTYDKTTYLFSGPSSFEENLNYLLNYVQEPYFTSENVEKEKGIIGQEIMMYDDYPDWRVYLNAMNAMYHNNPIKIDITGTIETISKIDKEILYKCYNTFYNPSNMVLVVSGDFEPEKILEEIKKRLIDKKSNGEIKRIYPDEPENIVQEKIEQKLEVSQPVYAIGIKDKVINCSSDNVNEIVKKHIAIEILLNLIIGRSSELYKKLYNQGIIYTQPSLDYEFGKTYAHVLITGQSNNPEKVYEEFKKEILKMKEKGVNKEDAERIKKMIYGGYIKEYDDVVDISRMFLADYFKGINSFDYLDEIEGINVEYLNQMLNNVFKEEKMVISIVKN